MSELRVTPSLTIPEAEIDLSFARAGGPGGQHVNTSATKVELRFDVDASSALSDEQKALVHERLANRITGDGVLVLTASEHRSQARNRTAVRGRLAALLAEAVQPPTRRKPTRRPRAANERRLEHKRRRARRKALRQAPDE